MVTLGVLFTLLVSAAGEAAEAAGSHANLTDEARASGTRVPLEAADIPHFARRFDLPCSACHLSPPKLNEYGEAFVRRNYRLPGREERSTVPLAVWVSTRGDLPPSTADPDRRLKTYVNRVEVISGGQILVPWLAYFVEWRPLSNELRADGSLRDRSGRFEDLFLTAQWDQWEVSVGQFRQVAQVDISRRLGVNEPAFFSTGLPGTGGTARTGSLRTFSLSGRAPTVRTGWLREVGQGWEWTSYVSVSVPGEISVPLTSEARIEASNELELRARGVMVESFVHRGIQSFGAHAFFDSRDRYLLGVVNTGRRGPLLWTGALGGAGQQGSFRGRASFEAEVVANRHLALGARAENLAGAPAAFIPYLNAHFPGTSYTFRVTLEHRERSGGRATFLELGAVF